MTVSHLTLTTRHIFIFSALLVRKEFNTVSVDLVPTQVNLLTFVQVTGPRKPGEDLSQITVTFSML